MKCNRQVYNCALKSSLCMYAPRLPRLAPVISSTNLAHIQFAEKVHTLSDKDFVKRIHQFSRTNFDLSQQPLVHALLDELLHYRVNKLSSKMIHLHIHLAHVAGFHELCLALYHARREYEASLSKTEQDYDKNHSDQEGMKITSLDEHDKTEGLQGLHKQNNENSTLISLMSDASSVAERTRVFYVTEHVIDSAYALEDTKELLYLARRCAEHVTSTRRFAETVLLKAEYTDINEQQNLRELPSEFALLRALWRVLCLVQIFKERELRGGYSDKANAAVARKDAITLFDQFVKPTLLIHEKDDLLQQGKSIREAARLSEKRQASTTSSMIDDADKASCDSNNINSIMCSKNDNNNNSSSKSVSTHKSESTWSTDEFIKRVERIIEYDTSGDDGEMHFFYLCVQENILQSPIREECHDDMMTNSFDSMCTIKGKCNEENNINDKFNNCLSSLSSSSSVMCDTKEHTTEKINQYSHFDIHKSMMSNMCDDTGANNVIGSKEFINTKNTMETKDNSVNTIKSVDDDKITEVELFYAALISTCLRGRHVYTAHRYFESVCRWKAQKQQQQRVLQSHKIEQGTNTETQIGIITDNNNNNNINHYESMNNFSSNTCTNNNKTNNADHAPSADEKNGQVSFDITPTINVVARSEKFQPTRPLCNLQSSTSTVNLTNSVSETMLATVDEHMCASLNEYVIFRYIAVLQAVHDNTRIVRLARELISSQVHLSESNWTVLLIAAGEMRAVDVVLNAYYLALHRLTTLDNSDEQQQQQRQQQIQKNNNNQQNEYKEENYMNRVDGSIWNVNNDEGDYTPFMSNTNIDNHNMHDEVNQTRQRLSSPVRQITEYLLQTALNALSKCQVKSFEENYLKPAYTHRLLHSTREFYFACLIQDAHNSLNPMERVQNIRRRMKEEQLPLTERLISSLLKLYLRAEAPEFIALYKHAVYTLHLFRLVWLDELMWWADRRRYVLTQSERLFIITEARKISNSATRRVTESDNYNNNMESEISDDVCTDNNQQESNNINIYGDDVSDMTNTDFNNNNSSTSSDNSISSETINKDSNTIEVGSANSIINEEKNNSNKNGSKNVERSSLPVEHVTTKIERGGNEMTNNFFSNLASLEYDYKVQPRVYFQQHNNPPESAPDALDSRLLFIRRKSDNIRRGLSLGMNAMGVIQTCERWEESNQVNHYTLQHDQSNNCSSGFTPQQMFSLIGDPTRKEQFAHFRALTELSSSFDVPFTLNNTKNNEKCDMTSSYDDANNLTNDKHLQELGNTTMKTAAKIEQDALVMYFGDMLESLQRTHNYIVEVEEKAESEGLIL